MHDDQGPYSVSPLSLPIRQEQKQKAKRGGTIALVVGLALCGVSAFAFTQGGAEVGGVVAGAFALALLGVGASKLKAASRMR